MNVKYVWTLEVEFYDAELLRIQPAIYFAPIRKSSVDVNFVYIEN